ncbi:MAG: hypothetical protein KKC10_11175 [Alphaproteobacteria bacterium]|nr:hypothetical protein [Alphaproteobacteria bacterium]
MPGKPDAGRRSQAVVIVHGMGEHRPMSTLRSFVEAVWSRDPGLRREAGHPNANKTWITPDERAGSHELRRITTPYVNGIRTDFYELYWADVTRGTTRSRLVAWVLELLWRKPDDIPADARRLYIATAVMTVLFAVGAFLVALGSFWNPLLAAIIAAVGAVLFWFLDQFVVPYFGDVASYVQATPTTVAQRAEVRERGLKLLRELSDDPRYDRIVLVGHSLGSILAYDLLQILWAERRPGGLTMRGDRALIAAIREAGAHAALPDAFPRQLADEERTAFRAAQWRLHTLLRARDGDQPVWKISDFVTLGSPLTHAEFLMAKNEAAFREGVAERLFSICPPLSDSASEPDVMYYERPRVRAMHHGACFAATRWTNVYDIGNLISTGDPISGDMTENFGGGVENVQVRLEGRLGRTFTHTLYWSLDAEGVEVEAAAGIRRSHLEVLRDAVDLGRRLES